MMASSLFNNVVFRIVGLALLLFGTTACGWFFNWFAEPPVYVSVQELLDRPALKGQQLYLLGAIAPETVQSHTPDKIITFELVSVSADALKLSEPDAVHTALRDPHAARIKVALSETTLPEVNGTLVTLLGRLEPDGVFHAELLLLHDASLHVRHGILRGDFGISLSNLTPTPGAKP